MNVTITDLSSLFIIVDFFRHTISTGSFYITTEYGFIKITTGDTQIFGIHKLYNIPFSPQTFFSSKQILLFNNLCLPFSLYDLGLVPF